MKMIIYLFLSPTGCNDISENSDTATEAKLSVSFKCSESEKVNMNSRALNPQHEKNITVGYYPPA